MTNPPPPTAVVRRAMWSWGPFAGAVLLQAAFRGRQARSIFHGHLVLTILRGVKLANKELLGKMDPVRTVFVG
jgi:hypothetical protein